MFDGVVVHLSEWYWMSVASQKGEGWELVSSREFALLEKVSVAEPASGVE